MSFYSFAFSFYIVQYNVSSFPKKKEKNRVKFIVTGSLVGFNLTIRAMLAMVAHAL